MKTFFKSLLGIVIICILAAVIVLFLFKSRIPDMVASRLSKTLKVGVEIGDIELSLSQIKVDNLEISNPRGFQLDRAFGVQELLFNAPLTRYLHNDIVIDEIDMNNVYIGLEFESIKSADGNWTAIMANAQTAQDKSSQSSSQKTVFIRRLILTNIQADLLYRSEGNVRHLPPIPRIELTNISSKGGDLSDQLMNTALGQMVKEIFIQENLKDTLDKIFKFPTNKTPNPVDVIQQFKGLLNAADENAP